jgi:hypothetical protein
VSEEVREVVKGDGYAVANVDGLGEGYGFRKIRRELGVTAFGANAIVVPEGYRGFPHVQLLLLGVLEFEFDGGDVRRLGPGGLARVDASTVRRIDNVGDGDAVYVCVGGKDGYVGRDGRTPEAAS